MKKNDIAFELGVSVGYLEDHWRDIVNSRKKQGIELRKRGRGSNADYGIKYIEESDFRWNKKEPS